MMPEQQQRILGYFIEEAKDHLNTIEQGLLNLQSTIEDSEMVNEVFRAAHSIKGGAAMLGIESVQQTSHRLEDYFKILKESPVQVDRTLESMFLQVFDALQSLVEELQGPFGLTEDKAQEVMGDVEPVFGQLEQHLASLVTRSAGAPAPVAAISTPAPVRVTSPVHAEESALKLVFRSDVPGHLRDMLALFKQADTPSSRHQLQACCDALLRIGEQFELNNWGEMLKAARRAVGNTEQTYRTLAPVLIKDLKQAQELVLSGRGREIFVSDAMQALVPAPVMEAQVTAEELDALVESSASITAEADLRELFGEEVAPAASQGADIAMDWIETPVAAEAAPPLGDFFDSGVTTGEFTEPLVPKGPEVGTAELNSLADLFEGEMSSLNSSWQEEQEDLEAGEEGPDIDISGDFSDLLDETAEIESSEDASQQDLADLFGDVSLDGDSSSSTDAAATEHSSTRDYADLFALSDEAPAPSTTADSDLDALLDSVPSGEEIAAEAEMDDLFLGSAAETAPEMANAFNDLGDLFDGSPGDNAPGDLAAELGGDLDFSAALDAPLPASDHLPEELPLMEVADPWGEVNEGMTANPLPGAIAPLEDVADPWEEEFPEETDIDALAALDALDNLAEDGLPANSGLEDETSELAEASDLGLDFDLGEEPLDSAAIALPEDVFSGFDDLDLEDLSADQAVIPEAIETNVGGASAADGADAAINAAFALGANQEEIADLDAALDGAMDDLETPPAPSADLDDIFGESSVPTPPVPSSGDLDDLFGDSAPPAAIAEPSLSEDFDDFLTMGEDVIAPRSENLDDGDYAGLFTDAPEAPVATDDIDFAALLTDDLAPEEDAAGASDDFLAADFFGDATPSAPDPMAPDAIDESLGDLLPDAAITEADALDLEVAFPGDDDGVTFLELDGELDGMPSDDSMGLDDAFADLSLESELLGTPEDAVVAETGAIAEDLEALLTEEAPEENDADFDALFPGEAAPAIALGTPDSDFDNLFPGEAAPTTALGTPDSDFDNLFTDDAEESTTSDLDNLFTDDAEESTTSDLDNLFTDDAEEATTSDLDNLFTDDAEEATTSDLDALLSDALGEADDASTTADFLNEAALGGWGSDPDEVATSGEDSGLDDLDALLGDEDAAAIAPEPLSFAPAAAELGFENSGFDDLEALLEDEEDITRENAASEPAIEFDDLEALLSDESSEESATDTTGDEGAFDDLDLLLDDEGASMEAISMDSGDRFDDLEKLLEEADQALGGSSPTIRAGSGGSRPSRRVGAMVDQTMRVSVKHLDTLSNLVGELVVNRNSLEQDQERLRQFLDNLLFQVQQLNDVGQRMRDLYERSLLESSLISSRQAFHAGGSSRSSDGNGGSHATGATFDALEMDRFTGFHTLSQEMIELIVRVRESASDIGYTVESSDQITRQFRQVTTQLQEGLNKARMVPFAQTADRLPRAVRDISLKCGKEARLVVEGRDTLIDKMILERLYDPMTHLVNNAITHGVETPEERVAGGKSREGTITLRAFYQGNQTVIYIADDGGGINPDIVKQKALKKGIITQAEARAMSVLDTYELLFRPGFSTRDKADDFAGRGVGMDVVRTALSEIRGSITIDSELGKGTSFTIRLPLTLSISKALSCLNNQARIAFPMDGVEDMFDVPKERVQTDAQGHSTILWRDSMLPFQPLSELLQFNRTLGRGRVYGGNQDEDMISIVVLRSANAHIGLQVDRVLGEQEIVIKQLEGPVPKPIGIAGATVLGDGRVMPIGDVLELIDLAQGRVRRDSTTALWSQGDTPPVEEVLPPKTEPTVLIVDDSITVRELLSMSFNKVGYRVEQARDGQEAWEKMRSGLPCDLVFCDIEMPRMDGLELLSRMQKDASLKKVPIAMLTSRGADRHRQMALDLGASGYFTKPYLEEALLDAAQRMLNGEMLLTKAGMSTEES